MTNAGTPDELLVLYAHEGFLRRLSISEYREKLVLKGGMLMAALDARRPIRDVDLSVHGLPDDEGPVKEIVAKIAGTLPAALATAKLKVQLDLSFGDPIGVRKIDYPTLLDDQDIALLGYPIELTLAEKTATMMSRGEANAC